VFFSRVLNTLRERFNIIYNRVDDDGVYNLLGAYDYALIFVSPCIKLHACGIKFPGVKLVCNEFYLMRLALARTAEFESRVMP
jgi:hypothetical protein